MSATPYSEGDVLPVTTARLVVTKIRANGVRFYLTAPSQVSFYYLKRDVLLPSRLQENNRGDGIDPTWSKRFTMHPNNIILVGEEQITLGEISQGEVEIEIDDGASPSAPPPEKTVSPPREAPRRALTVGFPCGSAPVAEKPEQPSKKRWWRI